MRRRSRWVEAASFSFLALIAVNCVLGRVAFSPDGKRFAAVVAGDMVDDPANPRPRKDPPFELWVTDIATGAHTLVVSDVFVGVSASFTPDGRGLVFLRKSGDGKKVPMTLALWDGTKVSKLAEFRMEDDAASCATLAPQVTPDGRSAFVTETVSRDVSQVVRIDLANGSRSVVAANAWGAVLSPEGDRLACFTKAEDPERTSVSVMGVAGDSSRVLAPVAASAKDVAISPIVWSPDGKRVVWADAGDAKAGKEGRFVLLSDDVASGETTRLAPDLERCMFPVFSAKGDALFFTQWSAKKDGPPRGLRLDLASGAVTAVPGGEGCIPAGVSPDGRWLALRRSFNRGEHMEAASVVRLVELATGEFRDDWLSPTQWIAFATSELHAAEEHHGAGRVAASAAAASRASAALEAMAKQFPGSAKRPDVLALEMLRPPTDTPAPGRNVKAREACASHLTQLARVFVLRTTEHRTKAQKWSGPSLWLAMRKGGAIESGDESVLLCPADAAARLVEFDDDGKAWDAVDLDKPAAGLCSYAGRDFARHPLEHVVLDSNVIGACLHHDGGALLAFDDGAVRFVTLADLGLSSDAEKVVGPDSKSPQLRVLR